MRAIIGKAFRKEWTWRLHANDGEVICRSVWVYDSPSEATDALRDFLHLMTSEPITIELVED